MKRAIASFLMSAFFATGLYAQQNVVQELRQAQGAARQLGQVSVNRLGAHSYLVRLTRSYVQQTDRLLRGVQQRQREPRLGYQDWQQGFLQLRQEFQTDWHARQDPMVRNSFQNLTRAHNQANVAVRRYMNDVRPGPGPGPGPGPRPNHGWQCVAVDDGWEEHRGGHVAEALNYNQAYQRAERLCRSAGHARCNIRCRQL